MSSPTLICCAGRLINVSSGAVMGIVNLTPDSFHPASRATTAGAIAAAEKHLSEGAIIIDLGGMSTRPGAAEISEAEEIKRVIPALAAIVKTFPEAIVSVDTYRTGVADAAAAEGASMINDVSGGSFDPSMWSCVVRHRLAYVCMHTGGKPATMQQNPHYENVVEEVLQWLAERHHSLIATGASDVIVDPGFGFGKTLQHNLLLLQNLHRFAAIKAPLMVGLSRKSTIAKLLNTDAEGALNGTTAVHTIAALSGAHILRTHDVREAVECLKIVSALKTH